MKKKRAPIPIHVQWVLDNTDVDTYDKSPEGEEYLFSVLHYGRLFFITKRRIPRSIDEFVNWLHSIKFVQFMN